MSKFRGPKDENFRRVAFAIQKIIEDKEPGRWYGTGSTSDAELEEILARDGLVQRSSRPVAHKRQKKPTGKRSLKVGASSTTSETPRSDEATTDPPRSDETTADQDDGGVSHPDLVYLEPYRRVPRIATPPTDDLYSVNGPNGSWAGRISKNALFGAVGIAVGAAADSLYRSKTVYTPRLGEAVLGNMMPGISSPAAVLAGESSEGVFGNMMPETSSPTPILAGGLGEFSSSSDLQANENQNWQHQQVELSKPEPGTCKSSNPERLLDWLTPRE